MEEQVVVKAGRAPKHFPAIQDEIVLPSAMPAENLWDGDSSRTKLIAEDLTRIEVELGL